MLLPIHLCRHKTGKLKASYRGEYFNVEGDVDLQVTGPVVKASSVLQYVYGTF